MKLKNKYIILAENGQLEAYTQRFELWKLNMIVYGMCIMAKIGSYLNKMEEEKDYSEIMVGHRELASFSAFMTFVLLIRLLIGVNTFNIIAKNVQAKI